MGIKGRSPRPLDDRVLELAGYNFEGDQAQNVTDLVTAAAIMAELMGVTPAELAAALEADGVAVRQAIAARPDVFGPRKARVAVQ